MIPLSTEGKLMITETTANIRDELDRIRTEFGNFSELVDRLRENVDEVKVYERRDTVVNSGSKIISYSSGEITPNVCCFFLNKQKVNIAPVLKNI